MPPSRRMRSGRRSSRFAPYRTSASLSTSEGWNCSVPAPIQRRAPLTGTPIPGTSVASVRPSETASNSGVIRRTPSNPWRASQCIATSPIAP